MVVIKNAFNKLKSFVFFGGGVKYAVWLCVMLTQENSPCGKSFDIQWNIGRSLYSPSLFHLGVHLATDIFMQSL